MSTNFQDHLNHLPASGIWSASLTPLTDDLSIDIEHLTQHAQSLLTEGCHGIGLFGTTGEANAFSVAERMSALESLLENGIRPKSLMVGTGCCSLSDTLALTQHAVSQGVYKVLMLPPFYYKNVTDEGLFNSYAEIIERTANDDLQLFLYHFPAMSQTPISVNLVAMLVERFPETIAGLKDSSGDQDSTLEFVTAFPKLAIFPGNEDHLLASLDKGCAGCISATANANPRGIRKIADAWLSGDHMKDDFQKQALLIRKVFVRHPLIAGLKQYASWSSDNSSWLRLRPPLTLLDDTSKAVLRSDIEALSTQPS